MSKKQDFKMYLNLEAKLQKKTTNFFLGYQLRVWKILQNGTKIGYKKQNQDQFSSNNIFDLEAVTTQELEDQNSFILVTPKRQYQIRTPNKQVRNQWMRAIAKLKKKNEKKKKRESSLPKKSNIAKIGISDSTLPSFSIGISRQIEKPITKKQSQRQTLISFAKNLGQTSMQRDLWDEQTRIVIADYIKKMPTHYANFHLIAIRLKSRSKQTFLSPKNGSYYMLFSSKSLYPDLHISQQNLSNSFLPHWAQVDIFYRLGDLKGNEKPIFFASKIKQIKQDSSYCSLNIIAGLQQFNFLCQSLEERKNLKLLLQTAKTNALQVNINNQITKKNYDILILLHGSNIEDFNQKVLQMISPLMPNDHHFQPEVIKKFIDNLCPLILQVLTILEHKQSSQTDTIISFLKVIHQQIKITLKLTWDTSNQVSKGGDILYILKSLSKYQSLVNKYIKDHQIFEAQKQLSKLYMRISYKNFQSIIIAIVEQQKKKNTFMHEEQGEQSYIETHGITDLFKFIYDVFDLAIPCWNNKLHLHNINRLMQRAISVFIVELKSMVDEEDLDEEQLIGVANNYVRFSQQIDQFYKIKFTDLNQKTKQSYDKLKDDYREVSMIIIDKLILSLKIEIKIYFQKTEFFQISTEHIFNLIKKSSLQKNIKIIHFLFKKKNYERLFSTIREQICKNLEKELKKNKKKPELNKVLEKIQIYRDDLVEMAKVLINSKLKIEKDLEELIFLLTSKDKQEIKSILLVSSQILKRVYFKILNLRRDYYEGSQLYIYLQENEVSNKNNLFVQQTQNQYDRRRSSFSKHYIQQFDRNSFSSSIEKNDKQKSQNAESQKIKLISQGFVMRNKNNTSNYEKIYLKLKKSILYTYENERMERCQNTIQIQNITEIKLPNPEKPFFIITFMALNRPKQVKIKCYSQEDNSRWIYSIQLQMRRINNDKKVRSKGIKIKQKKSKLIIDYEELNGGTDYFTYHE